MHNGILAIPSTAVIFLLNFIFKFE
jgi:hypothetical protein